MIYLSTDRFSSFSPAVVGGCAGSVQYRSQPRRYGLNRANSTGSTPQYGLNHTRSGIDLPWTDLDHTLIVGIGCVPRGVKRPRWLRERVPIKKDYFTLWLFFTAFRCRPVTVFGTAVLTTIATV